VPESGDAIQAMKAGIMEMADIYVVNKADRPGAMATATDIQSILQLKTIAPDGWRPPVLLTSSEEGDLTALDEAIESHLDWSRRTLDAAAQRRARLRHHVQSLIARRIDELLDDTEPEFFDQSLDKIYDKLVQQLRFSQS
jgi:LAO/AO transport system kinase